MHSKIRTTLALVLGALAAPNPTHTQGFIVCGGNGWGHLSPWVPPGTAPGHQAGRAVDVDGDTAVVAAPGGDAVHVYERVDESWVFVETLSDPNGTGNDFGEAVALAGKWLLVGSPLDPTDGPGAGVAHVFVQSGTGFVHHAQLQDPTPFDFGRFGTAVDLSGKWAGVGAPGDDNGVWLGGGAHMFRFQSGVWEHSWELPYSGGGEFGSALAIQEYPHETQDIVKVVVGAWSSDAAGADSGVIKSYCVTPGFMSTGPGTTPLGLGPGDYFGADLAFEGEHLIVGAYGDDQQGNNAGAAYVFHVDLGGEFWSPSFTLEEKLVACLGESLENFGRSVALDGSRVAVGSPNRDLWNHLGGGVQTWRLNPFSHDWSLEDNVWAEQGLDGDDFGWDVALDGETLLVGARRVDTAGNQGGAAYLVSMASAWYPGGQLPADVLATVRSYGAAKPGTHGEPVLESPDTPLAGEYQILQLSYGLPGSLPFLIWGLVPAQIPFDGGALHIGDPNVLPLGVTSPGGTSSFAWSPPSAPALCGLDVFMQVMFLDPLAGGPLNTAQTNGLQLTIGY